LTDTESPASAVRGGVGCTLTISNMFVFAIFVKILAGPRQSWDSMVSEAVSYLVLREACIISGAVLGQVENKIKIQHSPGLGCHSDHVVCGSSGATLAPVRSCCATKASVISYLWLIPSV